MSKPVIVERCISLISGKYVVKKRGKWSKPFKTIEEARAERDKIEIEQAPKPLGGALAKFYDEVYDPIFLDKLRVNTKKAYRSRYRTCILPYFENYQLAEISYEVCMEFQQSLIDLGWNLLSVNQVMSMLRVLLDHAVDYKRIADNPCKKVKYLKVRQKDKPTLSVDQIIQLVDSLAHPFKYGIAVAGLAGTRPCEIMAFKWEDFVLNEDGTGRISFIRSINSEYQVDELKTEFQYSNLPMSKTLVGYLKEYKAFCHDICKGNEDWLFQGKMRDYISKFVMGEYRYHYKPKKLDKYDFYGPTTIKSWWDNNIRYKYDFVPDNMCVKHLKHSFTTNVCLIGKNIKAIQRLCRHAKIETTLNTYAQVRPGGMEAEIESWEW